VTVRRGPGLWLNVPEGQISAALNRMSDPGRKRLTRHPRQAPRAALGQGTGGMSRIGNGEGEAGDDP
jgi:hypothetical protein